VFTGYPQTFALLCWVFASIAAVGAFGAYRNARDAHATTQRTRELERELAAAVTAFKAATEAAKREREEVRAEYEAMKVRFTRLAARVYQGLGKRDREHEQPAVSDELQALLELQAAYKGGD